MRTNPFFLPDRVSKTDARCADISENHVGDGKVRHRVHVNAKCTACACARVGVSVCVCVLN